MSLKQFYKSFLSLFVFFLFLLIISNTYPSHAAPGEKKHVAIRLLPEITKVGSRETITVGIEQTIADGWHTYWSNPGDSGTAARIEWSLGDIDAAPIQWPVPKKLPMGPLVNYGYEKQVILLQDVTMPHDISGKAQTVRAKIDILVCNEICIPETHEASFIINGDEDPVPAAIEMARSKLPLDMGWESGFTEKDGNLVVTVKTDTPSAFNKLSSIELYPEEWGMVTNTAMATASKNAETLTITQARAERLLSDVPVSKMVIAYEDANGERKAVRVSALNQTAAPATSADSGTIGIGKAIILALLGGLVLNLMPCVFPVLSMKALSLVQLKDKEARKARIHGLVYTAGILACFALIAGILIALKSSGAQVGWGFQLQHPAVILFLAYLFFTLGLNLSGFFEIDFGLANAGDKLTRKSGLTGSFFTGVLATLVATPCTAPFMGVAMGYALTQPAPIVMAVFMALGIGLALPYLVLTFVPAFRHLLPHPGAWMETFRQFLAWPMFASACWLVWVLSQQIDHMGQFAALLGMLAIAFGIWLLKSKPRHHFWRIVAMVTAGAVFLFAASNFITIKTMDEPAIKAAAADENWEDFTRAKLETYLQGDDPVFINMTAAWCITCKVNEKVALSLESTQDLFAQKGIKYLKGDWTNQNPEITNYLEEYGRSGVPIYVYYAPRTEKGGVRPDAVVLPQILTPGIVEKAINPQGEKSL